MFGTVGVMAEDRNGGTRQARRCRTAPFLRAAQEPARRRRIRRPLARPENRVLAVRGSFMRRSQDRMFGPDRRVWRPLYVVRRNIPAGHQRPSYVGGRRRTPAGSIRLRELPQFDYRFSTPGVFMQDEIKISDKWVVALSARADQHSEYGLLATPRVSVLSRPAPGWVIRLAAGTGTFAPDAVHRRDRRDRACRGCGRFAISVRNARAGRRSMSPESSVR